MFFISPLIPPLENHYCDPPGGPLGGSSSLNPKPYLEVIIMACFELASPSLQDSSPRPPRLDCAKVFLENCLRMCNVLASVCSEKKEAGDLGEVSQSKLVIAVPGEMELTRIKGMGRGEAIIGLPGWREHLESGLRLMKSRGLSSLRRGQEHTYMALRRRI